MVTKEEGPFDLFSRMRDAVGATRNGIPTEWEELSTYGKLFQCPYCISVWIALVLWLMYKVNVTLYQVIVMALFGSAVTALIEDYYDSNDYS